MTAPSTPQIPDELRPYLDTIADRLLSGHAAVMDQRAYLNRMLRLRWRPCARKKKTGSCAGLSYVASTNERQLRVQSLVDKAVFKSSHCVQLQCIYRVWVSRYP